MCECREGVVTAKAWSGATIPQNPLPAVHDCGYVSARNRLIPEAARLADAALSRGDPRWDREFLAAMNMLWERTRRRGT